MPAIISLPLRTVSEANAHQHWRARARRTKAQRAATQMLIWVARRGEDPFGARLDRDGHAEIRLTRVAPRGLDSDNLAGALKAVRDGVADALGVNDGDPRITWLYGQRQGGVREYLVEVTIT